MSSKRAPPLPQTTIDDLSDELLLRILCCMPPAQRPSLALVCKRWRAVCDGASPLWQELFLSFRHIYNSSLLYKWLLPRRGCVRALTVVTETEEDWLALHLVLGLVAAGLERLVVRAGREGLGMASVDWLSVLTHLRCLQLAYDRDSVVHEVAFPPGLETLVLRPVGAWAVLRMVPKGVAAAAALTSVQLRLLDMADAAADDSEHNGWYPLVQLTALQRLMITSSQLACLPGGMTALTGLSSLNLCGSAGSLCFTDPEGLTPLAALKNLAQLNLNDCDLAELPPPVAMLPALRTLLLSGNRLRALPSECGFLSSLESLDLSLSHLQALPQALLSCSRLECLDLSSMLARWDAQELRQLLAVNPNMRYLSISTSALPTSQLAKLQTSFPQVRVLEVDPFAPRLRGRDGDGGSPLLGSASSSSDDEDWDEAEEDWGGEEDESGLDGRGGEDGEQDSQEVDYPSSSEDELEDDEDSGTQKDL